MSKIFSTALLVSCATAQLTTSAWMAGTGDSDMTYVGSVISVKDDRTTLSISVKGMTELTELSASFGQTITLAGNTYYGFNAEAVEAGVTVNVIGECSRKNTDDKQATCSITTKGLDAAMSSACASAGSKEEMCSDGALDTSISTTLPARYFEMIQVVVTAGQDMLPSASAAATPSAGSASITTSSSSASKSTSPSDASKSAKPTSSGSEQPAASGASKTSKSAPEATNAAPLMTMVPALAGLGAAAAFFL